MVALLVFIIAGLEIAIERKRSISKIRLDIKRKIKKVHHIIHTPLPPTHTNWHKRTFLEQIHSVNVTKFPLPVQCDATNKSVSGWLWQSARSVSSVREYISLGLIFPRLFLINAQSLFALRRSFKPRPIVGPASRQLGRFYIRSSFSFLRSSK